jgi:cell division septal protein FtsQ
MTPNEVFALADIAGQHIFWVDPAQVRENLLRSPSLADAQVTVGWGTPLVTVAVQERQPALIWDQAGVQVWVDVAGRVMRLRDDTRELLRVVVDDVSLGPAAGEVDQEVVNSALQLSALLPDVKTLRYHPTNGLGFADPRGWEVWMGVGNNMDQRVQVYEALIGDLQDRGVQPRAIYLINPHRPWYSTV